jgi:PEGA domain
MRACAAVLLCFMVLFVTGCGTVVNGFHQDLAITSDPGGANVSVDGIPSGKTPIVASLRLGDAHVVKVEQPGYYPFEASVVPVTSTWEWGNIIFAGLIGLAVDAWTGGMYELSQDKVHASFPSQPNNSTKTASTTSLK